MTESRRINDVIISAGNSLRYSLTEPLILKYNRVIHEHEYKGNDYNPLISVYVPTYNRAKLLMERAISSVLKQTYKNFEFIIIGDHCTDKTESYVRSISDKRVSFYNIPVRKKRYPESPENHWFAGPVVAANEALRHVKGKWIARIDDDDIWTEDHLKILLEHAIEGNYEFVSAAYEAERQGVRNIIDAKDEVPPIGGAQTWLYRAYLKGFRYNINCWRKKWNRPNDSDIQDRFYKAGVRIGYVNKVVCTILPRPGENTIGLDAYKNHYEKAMGHYAFANKKHTAL
jgi:glycosyltransferase involved in cell wall biosynthesis